jgi:hypothetical protein
MFGFVICDITNEQKKWSNVKHMLKVCMFKYFQNHLMEMIKTCYIVMLLILLFTKIWQPNENSKYDNS